jgi:hypothetical protein
MTRSKKRSGIEWLGGLFSMPAYVTDDGERYRPEMLIWMDADGALLGHTMGKPGALIELAVESLRRTMDAPSSADPMRPGACGSRRPSWPTRCGQATPAATSSAPVGELLRHVVVKRVHQVSPLTS